MRPRIGLIFDGGGAKGAYQIGVWKALRELGLDRFVTAVAGTSVGGLNAALFVQDDPDKAFETAYHIWTNEIGTIKPSRITMALKKIIEENIDFTSFSQIKTDCFLSVFHRGQSGEYYETDISGQFIEKYVNNEMTYYNLRNISPKECHILFESCSTPKAIMLATSALPMLCRRVFIDKQASVDGGVPWGGDNSPVYPLSQPSSVCDIIITVHLSHIKNCIDKSQYSNVKIYELIPNVAPDMLGFFSGTINFDPHYSKYMINVGYNDSIDILRRLKMNLNYAEKEATVDNELKQLSSQRQEKKLKRLQQLSAVIDFNREE